MCAVTSIVDRSVRSIESIDGRYGGCWRRSSPKPPSHKPRRRLNSSSTPGPVDCARARCGGKRYPGCLSVPLPPKSPDFHPRQSPPNRPVPHRQVRRCSGKAHSRARAAAAAALARSIARAVCGGYGGGDGQLHRPSRALRAPRITRVYPYQHQKQRTHQHKKQRISRSLALLPSQYRGSWRQALSEWSRGVGEGMATPLAQGAHPVTSTRELSEWM